MEPKTISAGEYLAIRAQQQSARARAADACTQSAGETAVPRTVAGDDNTGDDTKMSSPTKTAIDSLVDQDMRDDSELSSQTKTANPSAGAGDTASSTAAERRSRCAERSPTPEVDYGSSDDQSEHGASGETKATSQSPALSFSPSLAASASPYSPPFSLADGSVKEEGEVDANLDRSDRDEGVLVTNSTQETEERAAYSTVEFQPWFPSSWVVERLDDYWDKRWPHRLFDVRPIDRDRYLARIVPNPNERRRFLIDIFFQRRLYGRHALPTEHDGLALTQAWNQFLVNVEQSGLERWLKLHSDARNKFETYSPYGACLRVHRWSRKEGHPCMVWADDCPQCHPGARWVRPEEFVRDGWVDRVSARLAQAIKDHERLVANRDDAAAAKGQQQRSAPRRTGRRGQGRPRGGSPAAPNYPPTADSRAIERDTSFDYHLAGHGDPAGARRSSAPRPSSHATVAVAAGTPTVPYAQGFARAPYDGRSSVHRDEVLQLQVALEKQRADALEARMAGHELERRLSSVEWTLGDVQRQLKQLTADYKALLGCLDRAQVPIPRKRSRTDGTDEADQRRT